jgi:hypothetical protein
MERSVFIVSDHTGLTAESVARSLLAQFEGIKFRYLMRPFCDTAEEVGQVVAEIEAARSRNGVRAIVFSTLTNLAHTELLKAAPALHFDLFRAYMGELEAELGVVPTGQVGRYHQIGDAKAYFTRIDAVDFALSADDGLGAKSYGLADVILIGPSRAGKTPTCLFLGLQYGIRAANYPLAEDDFEGSELPGPIKSYKAKVFGLIISPKRLQQIRTARKPDSAYASLRQCEYEVAGSLQLYKASGISYFDTTASSIEEIAANLMQAAGLSRRLG